jgi:nucleoside-diphosphate-sugar epimerase
MDKILILGGTHFLGRNLIEKLLENNTYDITLFNRQKTSPDLFPDLKKIKGDRSFDQSIKDTIKYYDHLNWPVCHAGLSYHKEKMLISKYKDIMKRQC